jgi:hypothetical protein
MEDALRNENATVKGAIPTLAMICILIAIFIYRKIKTGT